MRDKVFIGIKGTVLALDRTSGTEIWRTALKGSDFVTLLVDGSDLYATARGEIFCLDAATGTIRWKNNLRGLGWGLSSIATTGASASTQAPLLARKRKQEAEAAAAAGA